MLVLDLLERYFAPPFAKGSIPLFTLPFGLSSPLSPLLARTSSTHNPPSYNLSPLYLWPTISWVEDIWNWSPFPSHRSAAILLPISGCHHSLIIDRAYPRRPALTDNHSTMRDSPPPCLRVSSSLTTLNSQSTSSHTHLREIMPLPLCGRFPCEVPHKSDPLTDWGSPHSISSHSPN